MTSIIAGKYKGKKLFNYNDVHVRPTQAKIRKSIFQMLEPFEDLEILDLYAGIGTLGFEALSRGAKRAVFVEKDRRVYKVLEKNSSLFDNENISLSMSDVMKYMSRKNDEKFDVIFADPPYEISNYFILCEKIQCLLKHNGIFCMEMKKQNLGNFNTRIKYYGNTQVVFWKESA